MIQLENVEKSYGPNRVLKGINLTIEKGGFISVTGSSGSGKSTLLNLICGMDRPDKGTILVDGAAISLYNDEQLTAYRRKQIGFIFQFFNLLPNITVINKGLLQQLDTPQNLYDHPNNLFVAGFIGSSAMNFFPGKLRQDNGKLVVDTGDFVVAIPAKKAAPYEKTIGKDIIFGIRPENIHDSSFVPPNIAPEKVPVKVDGAELMGDENFIYLVSGKNTFVSRVDPRSSLRVGQEADVAFDMDSFHIFDAATEEAIR